MIPSNEYSDLYDIDFTPIETSIKRALTQKPPTLPSFHQIRTEKNTVRSVQRIANPSERTVKFVARIYPIWLTKTFAGLVDANFDGKYVKFSFFNLVLLELKVIKSRSDEKRQLFFISGGLLVKRHDLGWL